MRIARARIQGTPRIVVAQEGAADVLVAPEGFSVLDVIAAGPDRALVFVEVKTRTGDGFGGLEQAVTPAKVRRIRRLAAIWLADQDQSWAAIRIDVIGVRIGRQRTPEITHLRGIG